MVVSLFNSNFKVMKFLNHLVDDMSLPHFFKKLFTMKIWSKIWDIGITRNLYNIFFPKKEKKI